MTALLIPVIFSACGSVPIKEETFYTDAGDSGAVISHFFSTDTAVIGKAAWDELREGMTCESGQAIGDIKDDIEKLCSKVSCEKQTLDEPSFSKQDVATLRKTVLQLDIFLRRLTDGNRKDLSR